MRQLTFHTTLTLSGLLLLLLFTSSATSATLEEVIQGDHRDVNFKKRDAFRHPLETLQFFGIQPNMTVAEIWPSPGWYSEILAPYLRDQGQYFAVGFSLTAKRTPQWRRNYTQELINKFNTMPSIYGKTKITSLAIPEDINIAPSSSVDLILTFRNTHNWIRGDYAEAVFKAMYASLKPGGILGLVQHRATESTALADIKRTGYVPEPLVIQLAQQAGFKFVAKSEINANPKDSKNYPEGVWTLPPSLRLGEKDKDHYLAIGESDRMTLKFQKPK